jgi:hypothetical protein
MHMEDLQTQPLTGVRGFFHRYSFSIVSGAVLLLWLVLYFPANPDTHWGSFFGNAIADWSGVVATVICTRILYERGNPDCRRRVIHEKNPFLRWIKTHSLTVFFGITLLLWIALFAYMSATSKWGQVVGNVVSEWTQILGVIWLTKRFVQGSSVRDHRMRHAAASSARRTPQLEAPPLPDTPLESYPSVE